MTVLGNISLASEALPPDSPGLPFMQAASMAAIQMSELPRDLLAYAGRGLFPVEALDLSDFVRKTEPLIRRALPSGVELILQLAEDLAAIEADASQLQTVILHLVKNAVEAIGGPVGGVAISTSSREIDAGSSHEFLGYERVQPGLYSCFQIRDSGCGMDENSLSRMFDPFFSTKDAARGLGLSTVLGILRSHRAGMQVTSIPGKGSTFTVCLPAIKS
jgi:two-component system cell cycle sensor histidine kinase/response regulator CckA